MPEQNVSGEAALDSFFLDPNNPRLGRHNIAQGLSQDRILGIMQDWSLEELALSLLESGFWPQEALIAVREAVPGRKAPGLVVVEGNRRLAALKMLAKARDEDDVPAKWTSLIRGYKPEHFKRLASIPYILKASRKEVLSYIGFRHVTGIKEWNPAEKAEFIAKLIEEEKLTYDQVRKRIGSKAPTVRQHYISYRVLLQMETSQDDVSIDELEKRFSVLYLSLKTQGAQTYLNIDIAADPKAARTPVPRAKLEQLASFARWLFGTEKDPPLFSDSRYVDDFGRILESPAAIEYLERSENPSFNVARRMAGVAESEIAAHVERAADELEEALRAAHQHKSSRRLQDAVRRVALDALELLTSFPIVQKEILKEMSLKVVDE